MSAGAVAGAVPTCSARGGWRMPSGRKNHEKTEREYNKNTETLAHESPHEFFPSEHGSKMQTSRHCLYSSRRRRFCALMPKSGISRSLNELSETTALGRESLSVVRESFPSDRENVEPIDSEIFRRTCEPRFSPFRVSRSIPLTT